MKAERVILSFVAVIVGLVAAGVAFYLYQMTRIVPDEKNKPVVLSQQTAVTPTSDPESSLTIDSPKEEEVFDKKMITVSGKTSPDATVVVSSEEGDQAVKPASNGNFTLSQSIPTGTTLLHITAIFPSGQEKSVKRTVTFSTENF
jgi:cytoskeletal protein RodZ